MTRFLVDTNVIIDVLHRDPVWGTWSESTIERCACEGPLAINPIIWAELAVGFSRIEDLDAALPESEWARLPLPWAGGYLAGRVFNAYRRMGGVRTSPLPDFYIGAHAAVDGLVLVTRDARRYRTYFPKVQVIAP